MERALHPLPTPFYKSCDRLCYSVQIPELGIFIVGSPQGRAGVFSLYSVVRPGQACREYGFKLEYILPFEAHNEREVVDVGQARLVGVAVAPVQGSLLLFYDKLRLVANMVGCRHVG